MYVCREAGDRKRERKKVQSFMQMEQFKLFCITIKCEATGIQDSLGNKI